MDERVLSFRDPVLEGFALQTSRPGLKAEVRRIAAAYLGRDWEVSEFGEEKSDFELLARGGVAITADRAWEMTYRLRALPNVLCAEPLFAFSLAESRITGQKPQRNRRGHRKGGPAREQGGAEGPVPAPVHLPESDPVDWSIQQMKVYRAWDLMGKRSCLPPGYGILVGHPDTGCCAHPEVAENVLAEKGWDFVANEPSGLDELTRAPSCFPGHGTAAASVIISPGEPLHVHDAENVVGIAPGAKLLPLRVSPSVAHLSTARLGRAIEHAARNGCHVIPMTLGGLFSYRLRKAITCAQSRGIIIVAAAGDRVPFVVWPAAYDEVIAVAANNARDLPWEGSSRGRMVDCTAPGESVWVARVAEGEEEAYTVGRASGTSLATAAVAGVAALWLSYHGRDRLVGRYGAEKVPFVFNQVLRAACTAEEWCGEGYGAGMVDAEKVLSAELPDGLNRSLCPPAAALQGHHPLDSGSIETFEHLFEAGTRGLSAARSKTRSSGDLRGLLASFLGTGAVSLQPALREIGQELAFHLAVHPELYETFGARLSCPPSRVSRRGSAHAPNGRRDVDLLREMLLRKGVSAPLRRFIAP